MYLHHVIYVLVLVSQLQAAESHGKRKKNIREELLPEPHIIILGPTGVGKSSLANVLIGQSPDCKNCTFEICSGTDSCTKETTYAVGQFNGVGPTFTIVDTPGFGDSDNDDSLLIDEMTTVLEDVIKTANTLYLMFNGESKRFDANVQQMIREMEALFGEENFWNHTVMGVSFWSFSEQDQMERNYTGKTEEWWAAEMNRQLHEKFHTEFDLPAVFIDSWAKMPFNLEDLFQQEAYERETAKLWDLTMQMTTFEFKTIDDVLDELSECKSTLETEIAELWAAVEVSNENIASLNASVQESNEGILKYIADSAPPLGTIVPWTFKVSSTSVQITDIPAGWQLCDGDFVKEGPWKGSQTPNLNGEELFLRGAESMDRVLEFEDDMFQDHKHKHVDQGHNHTMEAHSHNVEAFMLGGGDNLEAGWGGYSMSHGGESDSTTSKMINATSNILVDLVNSDSDYRSGYETRPRNMRILYIIRIF